MSEHHFNVEFATIYGIEEAIIINTIDFWLQKNKSKEQNKYENKYWTKFTAEELFNKFYDICQKHDIKNTEFFRAAYKAIIGKEKGPRLAEFILTIGKDKVIKLLDQL